LFFSCTFIYCHTIYPTQPAYIPLPFTCSLLFSYNPLVAHATFALVHTSYLPLLHLWFYIVGWVDSCYPFCPTLVYFPSCYLYLGRLLRFHLWFPPMPLPCPTLQFRLPFAAAIQVPMPVALLPVPLHYALGSATFTFILLPYLPAYTLGYYPVPLCRRPFAHTYPSYTCPALPQLGLPWFPPHTLCWLHTLLSCGSCLLPHRITVIAIPRFTFIWLYTFPYTLLPITAFDV